MMTMMRDLKTEAGYFSIGQQKAVAIVPKISSLLSLFGSLYIVYDVARLPKSRRNMYHRILLGTSISDVFASVAWFFSTWATDPDVLPLWGASGTQQTCAVQGFFAQTPLASVIYSGWLAVYYYLVIRCGWNHARLRRSKIEWFVHTSSIIMGVATATASAALGLLNPLDFTCWIAGVPLGCDESWLNNGETNCVRGDNATLYQWVYWYIPLWMVIAVVTVIMGSIIWKFYNQEQHNEKHRRSAVGKRQAGVLKSWSHSKLGDIVWQSLYYVGSFYLTWTFPTVFRITQVKGEPIWYHWVILTATFVPSQGIWNVMIYLRPQYIRMRQHRLRKADKQRLNVTSASMTGAGENDPTRSMAIQQAFDESEVENSKEAASGRQDEGRSVSFSLPSRTGTTTTTPIEEPMQQSRKPQVPERPKMKKEHSRVVAYVRDVLLDIKAVVIKGDEGINNSCIDDTFLSSVSRDSDMSGAGMSGELGRELEIDDDDDGGIIETDDAIVSAVEPEHDDDTENAETNGAIMVYTEPEDEEETGKEKSHAPEQWHEQESNDDPYSAASNN